jgi:membrane protein DedA with SNARE-associated domain
VIALLNPTSLVASSGYAAIFALSVLQSCCVPTSSELTLGFAGVLAYEGKLSLPGAIVAGVLGEIVGAYIAWFIGRAGGRRFVDRFGKYILLSHHDLDRAENWYRRHPRWGVFGSRLLPVIRNFVAVPAGVAEVPLVRFGILTALGSLIWDGAMALIGYGVGSRWRSVMHGFNYAGYILGVLAVAAIAFVIYHRYRSYKAATTGGRQWSPGSRVAASRGTGPAGGRPGAGGRPTAGRRPAPGPMPASPPAARPRSAGDPETAPVRIPPAPVRPQTRPPGR